MYFVRKGQKSTFHQFLSKCAHSSCDMYNIYLYYIYDMLYIYGMCVFSTNFWHQKRSIPYCHNFLPRKISPPLCWKLHTRLCDSESWWLWDGSLKKVDCISQRWWWRRFKMHFTVRKINQFLIILWSLGQTVSLIS